VLTRRTVEKWIKENDKELDTSIWLKFDVVPGDHEHVSTHKCGVCMQFSKWLTSLRNYNPALINGSKDTRTSAFKEHADAEMHKRALMLYKKQHSTNVCEYAPIAKAILQPSMDEATRQKLKRKFEIFNRLFRALQVFPIVEPSVWCDWTKL